ncbi:hypothetical protein JCM33374_g4428 [Metschnikowia sp. JCM 33374]|nr:hypothetical protein JCM33374_g4428 [Metschnikowia sp. JCM 33374]
MAFMKKFRMFRSNKLTSPNPPTETPAIDINKPKTTIEGDMPNIHFQKVAFGFRGTLMKIWHKLCGLSSDVRLREWVLSLLCGKMFLMDATTTSLVDPHNSGAQEYFSIQDRESGSLFVHRNDSTLSSSTSLKSGLRGKISGKIKRGASKLKGKMRIQKRSEKRAREKSLNIRISDGVHKLKLQLGLGPDVVKRGDFDYEPGFEFTYTLGSGVTITKGRTLGSLQSPPYYAPSPIPFQAEYNMPISSPIDMDSLMEQYHGLETIYITDEANFFINNFSGQTEAPEYTHVARTMTSYILQNDRLTKVSQSAMILSDVVSRCTTGLRRNDGQSARSIGPPQLVEPEIPLKPLLLVKGPKRYSFCFGVDDVCSGTEERSSHVIDEVDRAPVGTSPRRNNSISSDYHLKELKILRRRSDQGSYTMIPVWQNLVNTTKMHDPVEKKTSEVFPNGRATAGSCEELSGGSETDSIGIEECSDSESFI